MADPRIPLAGRYAFQGLLRTSQGPRRWIAIENETGRRLVAVPIEGGRLQGLIAAKGVKRRHVAAIVDVVKKVDPDSLPEGVTIPISGGVALAEFMPGRTLRQQIDAGRINPTKAVAWTLRLAESVLALHESGAIHGAISPRSVIAEPDGRKLPPVLSQLVAPSIGPFCPPERLKGAAESAADDVWALHALLYTALTREPPFKGETREALTRQMLTGKPKPLASFDIDEPVLDEILAAGLIGEKRLRVTDLAEVSKLLDGWERDPEAMPPKRAALPRPAPRSFAEIVGTGLAGRDDGIVIDEDILPEDEGQELKPQAPPLGALPEPPQALTPGPAPAGSAFPNLPGVASTTATSTPLAVPAVVQPPKRPSINPFEKKKALWPLLVGAALAGGAGVYLAVEAGADPPKKTEPTVQAVIVPTAAPREPAKKKKNAAEERNACVASYFEVGGLLASLDYAWVCADGDLRDISIKLHDLAPSMALVDAGPIDGGTAALEPPKDAGVRGTGLGWYELPATAIIRRHCCVGTTPTLPETPGWCEQLQNAVKRVADDSSGAGDLSPSARAFDKAVNCLFANKVTRPYVYDKPPNDWNRRGFQQFLGRAAVSEARR